MSDIPKRRHEDELSSQTEAPLDFGQKLLYGFIVLVIFIIFIYFASFITGPGFG